MSAQGYCRSRKLSNSRIGYWQRRLRHLKQDEQDESTATSAGFIQIKPPVKALSAAIATGMEVMLPNGLRLSLSHQAHLPWVTTILETLMRVGAPC